MANSTKEKQMTKDDVPRGMLATPPTPHKPQVKPAIKGSATIILCGRKNMSVTLWFTVLKRIYEADYFTPLSGTKYVSNAKRRASD